MYGIKGLSGCLFGILLFALFIYLPPAHPQQLTVEDGEIHGAIYSRETGDPLANATVRLVETGRRALTDENGEFRFDILPPGDYTLSVVAVGYALLEEGNVAAVKSGETIEVKIYLAPVKLTLDEVEVRSSSIPATVGKQSVGIMEIKRIPGSAGDALRALQALPGIGVANDFDGQLYIRGGSPDDNRFYLDRAPLFYPYHFWWAGFNRQFRGAQQDRCLRRWIRGGVWGRCTSRNRHLFAAWQGGSAGRQV